MSLETDIAVLTSAPLFSLLDRHLLRLLAFGVEPRALQEGDILFRKGDASDGGFVVIEGAIALDAGDGAPIFVAEPGAVIGQTALFIDTTRPATATARARSAVMRISPRLMHQVLRQFPSAVAALYEALAADILSFADNLERVGRSMPIPGRHSEPCSGARRAPRQRPRRTEPRQRRTAKPKPPPSKP
jgi:CRP-like cAMP-binding protein